MTAHRPPPSPLIVESIRTCGPPRKPPSRRCTRTSSPSPAPTPAMGLVPSYSTGPGPARRSAVPVGSGWMSGRPIGSFSATTSNSASRTCARSSLRTTPRERCSSDQRTMPPPRGCVRPLGASRPGLGDLQPHSTNCSRTTYEIGRGGFPTRTGCVPLPSVAGGIWPGQCPSWGQSAATTAADWPPSGEWCGRAARSASRD